MIKVGITHGDINGVGYEIILKTFAEDRMMELCIRLAQDRPFVSKSLGI